MSVGILIRPFKPEDAQPAYQAVCESQPEIANWMADLHSELTLQDVKAYIAAQPEAQATRRAYNFAIVDQNAGSFCGGCGLTLLNWTHRHANVYYWVRASRQGQNIATNAALQLADYAFTELGLVRLEIVVAAQNRASVRVAEKTGARREGLLRNRIYLRGRLYDAWMFSLLPIDLNGR